MNSDIINGAAGTLFESTSPGKAVSAQVLNLTLVQAGMVWFGKVQIDIGNGHSPFKFGEFSAKIVVGTLPLIFVSLMLLQKNIITKQLIQSF